MIAIYHKDTLNIIKPTYPNHDIANTALHTMTEQRIISTINLAVADETELEYLRRSRPVKASEKKPRGRKRGHKCPWEGMTMKEYRKSKGVMV